MFREYLRTRPRGDGPRARSTHLPNGAMKREKPDSLRTAVHPPEKQIRESENSSLISSREIAPTLFDVKKQASDHQKAKTIFLSHPPFSFWTQSNTSFDQGVVSEKETPLGDIYSKDGCG